MTVYEPTIRRNSNSFFCPMLRSHFPIKILLPMHMSHILGRWTCWNGNISWHELHVTWWSVRLSCEWRRQIDSPARILIISGGDGENKLSDSQVSSLPDRLSVLEFGQMMVSHKHKIFSLLPKRPLFYLHATLLKDSEYWMCGQDIKWGWTCCFFLYSDMRHHHPKLLWTQA